MNPVLGGTGEFTRFEYSNNYSHCIDPNVVLSED
jgi:hypothetical protein